MSDEAPLSPTPPTPAPLESRDIPHVNVHVEIPPASQVRVTVSVRTSNGDALGEQTLTFGSGERPSRRSAGGMRLLGAGATALAALRRLDPAWLMAIAVGLYTLTRLIALDSFPIYFFTDEAVQTVLAADFLRDGLRSYTKELLPTFFVNGSQYNLGVSVYLQILPYILFGKSVYLTRLTPMLVGLLAPVCAGLTLRDVFHSRRYWLGALIFSVTPAWFLHSRTAFETALAVALYTAFLYFYLLYRSGRPRMLYVAVAMAALCFYSYSPAQLVVALTALLLFSFDIGYHWRNRRVVLTGLGLALLLALPYVRFLILHPTENANHLMTLDSYWIHDLTIGQKLGRFAGEYVRGLNPFYWFLPNNIDLARHVMKNYGHLLRPSLPFFLLGVVLAARRFRQPGERTLLLALLAAPAGAALAGLSVTRALFFVAPAVLLTAIGCDALLDWLERRKLPGPLLNLLLFLTLAFANVYMLVDAVRNGPLWSSDYGLGGMQYGARQLFPALKTFADAHPDQDLIVSPSWANGTDVISRFYYGDQPPYQMGTIDGYIENFRPLDDHTTFVMIPEELERARASGKFTDLRVIETIPYPDGSDGFSFVQLQYVDNIQTIFANEREARRALQEKILTLPGGEAIKVSYSVLDMGSIEDLFDGRPNSLVRTREANPLQVNIAFEAPREVSRVILRVGGTASRILIEMIPAGDSEAQQVTLELGEAPEPRTVELPLTAAGLFTRANVSVWNANEGEPSHVHLWEIELK